LAGIDQTVDPLPEDDTGARQASLHQPDHAVDQTSAREDKIDHTVDLLPEEDARAQSASLGEGLDHTLDLEPDDAQAGADLSREEQSLPGYDLVKRLGSGATGSVWEAIQLSTGQKVAVKVLGRITRAHDQLFQREMQQLVLLRGHNHIVSLLDASLDHNPPFLVMPLFHQSLEFYTVTRANLGLLTNERVSRWFTELAGALRFVHQRGILHCDVKPPNVLLDRDQAKLADFGQAALLGKGQARLGTFFYMPAEQAASAMDRSIQADATWDVYALAATIYHLLTGEPPRYSEDFEHELTTAGSVTEQLKTYSVSLRTAPLKPVRSNNPECDRDLAMILETCLQSDPTKRYQDMGEVLDDLERRHQKRPLACRPRTLPYALQCWLRRNPALFLLFSACTFLIVLAFFRTHQAYRESDLRRVQAEKAQSLAETQLQKSVMVKILALLEQQRSSGAAILAKLTENDGKALTHWTQLADALRYRPFPLANFRAKLATWCDQEVLLVDNNEVLLRSTKGSTRKLGTTTVGEPKSLQLDPTAGVALLLGSAGWEVTSLHDWTTIIGADEPVDQAALGRNRVALARGNIIDLWSLQPAKKLTTLVHHDQVRGLSFSPDGQLLASASSDRTSRLWTVQTEHVKARFLWHDDEVTSVCFSPDGRRLLTGSRDGSARQWDTASGVPQGPTMAHDSPIRGGAYSPDGRDILLFTSSGQIRRWSKNGTILSQPINTPSTISEVRFSPDGDAFLAVSEDMVWVWDSQTSEQRFQPIEMVSDVSSAGWSPDGRSILTNDVTGSGWLFGLRHTRPIPKKLRIKGGLKGCSYGPDGRTIAAVTEGKVQVYDIQSQRKVGAPIEAPGIYSALMSTHGNYLVTFGWQTHLWDLDKRTSLMLHPGVNLEPIPHQVAFSPTSSLLAVTGYGKAKVLNPAIPTKATHLSIVGSNYTTFSGDGKKVYFSSPSSGLVYDLDKSAEVTVPTSQDAVLVKAKDGHNLLTAGTQGLSETNLGLGKQQSRQLLSRKARYALNPSGGHHAVYSNQGLSLLNAQGKLLQAPLLAEEGPYDQAVFSSDGNLIATIRGQRVRVWLTLDGSPWTAWMPCSDDIRALTFNPMGTQIACSLADGTIRFIDLGLDSDLPAELARQEAVRRAGWKADSLYRPSPDYLPSVEWEAAAAAHAKKCLHPESNFWMQRNPP
jgi:WD40 repeat protein